MGLITRHATLWKTAKQPLRQFMVDNKVMSDNVKSQWFGFTPDGKPVEWGVPEADLINEAASWKEESQNGVSDLRKQYILERLSKAGITQGKWIIPTLSGHLERNLKVLIKVLEDGNLGCALEITCSERLSGGLSMVLVGISTPDFNDEKGAMEILSKARQCGLRGVATYKPIGVTLLEDHTDYKMKIFPFKVKKQPYERSPYRAKPKAADTETETEKVAAAEDTKTETKKTTKKKSKSKTAKSDESEMEIPKEESIKASSA